MAHAQCQNRRPTTSKRCLCLAFIVYASMSIVDVSMSQHNMPSRHTVCLYCRHVGLIVMAFVIPSPGLLILLPAVKVRCTTLSVQEVLTHFFSKLLYTFGQDFLGIQYVVSSYATGFSRIFGIYCINHNTTADFQ